MSIPQAAYLYQTTPNAIKSSTRVSRFQPVNGSSFTNNSNNVIRIEIKSDGYLTNECYLKFAITNNSGGNVHLDAYATAVFNRVRLLCNGTVLSDIQGYNMLSNMLINSQASDDFQRILQTTCGASLLAGDALAPADGANAGERLTASQNYGFNALAPTGNANNFHIKYYSIPLISGFINSSRFIPLALLSGSGLVLELYLESNFAAVFNSPQAFSGTQTFTLSEVEFIGKIVTIEDEKSEAMIKAMWQTQGLKIKCSDWQTHFNTIQAGVSNSTITIPDRSACLKSLFTILTHAGGHTNVISALQSYKFNNSAYQYRIGSVLYPNQEVSVSATNLLESMSEHLKALNTGIFNLKSSTYLKPTTWGNDTTYTAMGTYSMTYDFEAYSESPDLFSGIDTATLGLPITLNMKFSAATPVILNAVTFAHKDVVYSINPDGTITKFE